MAQRNITEGTTAFITGVSSGIGASAADYLLTKGWKVAGTVKPGTVPSSELIGRENFLAIESDVTDTASTERAVQEAHAFLGSIHVLVNNAGYGLIGPFEALSEAQIQEQFETNFFGALRVTRACLPYMKAQRQGTIIMIASMFGRIGMPFFSAYGASKWALEGFSEGLAQELEPFGVQVTLIEPGAIKTGFFQNAVRTSGGMAESYSRYAPFDAALSKKGENGDSTMLVNKAIYAATKNPGKFRRRPDFTARLLTTIRRWTSLSLFSKIIQRAIVSSFIGLFLALPVYAASPSISLSLIRGVRLSDTSITLSYTTDTEAFGQIKYRTADDTTITLTDSVAQMDHLFTIDELDPSHGYSFTLTASKGTETSNAYVVLLSPETIGKPGESKFPSVQVVTPDGVTVASSVATSSLPTSIPFVPMWVFLVLPVVALFGYLVLRYYPPFAPNKVHNYEVK